MKARVIHIYGREDADIACYHCGKIGKIPVSSIPAGGKEYRVKCKCGEILVVKFEKRRSPRSSKNLMGVVCKDDQEYWVDLRDLSTDGCSFNYRDKRCGLNIGDQITIRFRLDSAQADLIECSAIVRSAEEAVGVEFFDMKNPAKRALSMHLGGFPES